MPLLTPDTNLSMSQLNIILEELQQKVLELDVPVYPQERKQEIMNLLHEFNDVKDAAQIVVGKLANMENKTIKEMHLFYKLPLNE